LKWFTYFVIRKRVDRVAFGGFQQLIRNVSGQVSDRGGIRQLNLIGHSFGGRMLILGLQHFLSSKHVDDYGNLFENLMQNNIAQINIITLNAAVAPREVMRRITNGHPPLPDSQTPEAPPTVPPVDYAQESTLIKVIEEKWHGHFFNVFSRHDLATGVLFPAASQLTTDDATRAIGAAPFGTYQVLKVSESGHIQRPKLLRERREAVWNIDASKIVFDHSDIYKGRVATMLHELMREVEPGPHAGHS